MEKIEISPELESYLKKQLVLIVEPSKVFATSIATRLGDMGVSTGQIFSAHTYKEAERMLIEHKPQILITEYRIGNQFGLNLISQHEKNHEESVRISMIVTFEASDSAAAEAAEEQVDAYLLKPFSPTDFSTRIIEILNRKTNPSDYTKKIREGKNELYAGHLENAVALFQQATQLNSKPTSAYYYLGSCYVHQAQLPGAINEFTNGLRLQPLHYNCLIGQFDCLMEEKKYVDAYRLVRVIKENFPVTSGRLGKFFIAAVYTGNFQDLSDFYDLFLTLEMRPPELINLVGAALLTAGRYFIRSNQLANAISYFDMGSTVAARNIEYLEKIIDELIRAKDYRSADLFVRRILPDDVGTNHAAQLKFKVDRHVQPPEKMIDIGRKMIVQENYTPEVARSLIQLIIENGKMTLAESIVGKVVDKYPELRKELYELIETASQKSG